MTVWGVPGLGEDEPAACDLPKHVTQLGEAEGALDTFMTHAVLRKNVPASTVPHRLEVVKDVISDNIDLDRMEQFPSRESVPTIQSYSSLAAPPTETPSLVTVAITLGAPDVGMRTYVVKIARPCAGDQWKVDSWQMVRNDIGPSGSVHPPSPR